MIPAFSQVSWVSWSHRPVSYTHLVKKYLPREQIEAQVLNEKAIAVVRDSATAEPVEEKKKKAAKKKDDSSEEGEEKAAKRSVKKSAKKEDKEPEQAEEQK